MESLTLQVEDQAEFQFPNVGILQIMDRHDSPKLRNTSTGMKCFVTDYDGGFGDNVPNCRKQSQDVILGQHYCNCTDMWHQSLITSPLNAHVDGITYRLFEPTSMLKLNATTTTLVLQIYFVCKFASTND